MSTLSDFTRYRYLAVETYRRNGAGVVTPVWFVAQADRLYFSAPAHTGKVKRLRHSPQARVAPCDERGTLLDSWIAVTIKPTTDAEAQQADQLLKKRYSWQRWLLDAFGWLRRWRYTHYSIEEVA